MSRTVSIKTNLFNELLPYIVTFVAVFQVALQYYIANNIHWIIILSANLYVIVNWFVKERGRLFISRSLVFCLIILLWIGISLFMLPSILIPLIGALDYLVFFAFWTFYFASKSYFSIDHYSSFIVFMGVILAILGIYQFFIDYTVFGIASYVSSINTPEKAAYMSAFRASSIMTSTQEFSMFMGLSIGLCFTKWNKLRCNEIFKWSALGILLLGGVVAGGKVVALIAGIPFIVRGWALLKKRLSLPVERLKIVILLLIIVVVFSFFCWNHVFKIARSIYNSFIRIFVIFTDFERFLHQESIRATSMKKIFSGGPISFLIGRGLGTSSYSAYNVLGKSYNFQRTTLESYFLSLGYEMGIVGFLSFIYFFFGAVSISKKRNDELWMILLGVVLSMFFTPTFYSFSMVPVAGLFIYIFYRDYYEEESMCHGKVGY